MLKIVVTDLHNGRRGAMVIDLNTDTGVVENAHIHIQAEQGTPCEHIGHGTPCHFIHFPALERDVQRSINTHGAASAEFENHCIQDIRVEAENFVPEPEAAQDVCDECLEQSFESPCAMCREELNVVGKVG